MATEKKAPDHWGAAGALVRSASSARWGAADVIQTLCPHGGSAFKQGSCPGVEYVGGKRIVPLRPLRFLNH